MDETRDLKDCRWRVGEAGPFGCRLIETITGRPSPDVPANHCQACLMEGRDRTPEAPGMIVAGNGKNIAKATGDAELLARVQPHCRKPTDAERIVLGATTKITMRTGCIHLGDFVRLGKNRHGQPRQCPGCQVHGCGLHGTCTRGRNDEGIRSCLGCPDFRSDTDQPDPPAPPATLTSLAPIMSPTPLMPAPVSRSPPGERFDGPVATSERRGVSPPSLLWSVGMTIAPRAESTWVRCLESLIAAGWTEPHLFVEPGVEIPPRFRHLPATIQTAPTGGAWPHWMISATTLTQLHPHAERYLIVQDDALFATPPVPLDGGPADGTLAERLAGELPWKDRRFGMATLFASRRYDGMRTGAAWFPFARAKDNQSWLYSAQALAFSNESLHDFLGHPRTLKHRRFDRRPDRRVDKLIGNWAQDRGRTIWLPDVSIVKHVGETSTLWGEKVRATGHRQCSRWLGDLPVSRDPRAPFSRDPLPSFSRDPQGSASLRGAANLDAPQRLSVCIPHLGRRDRLESLLADLARQTIAARLEVIVADFDDPRLAAPRQGSDSLRTRTVPLTGPFNRAKALNAAADAAWGDAIFWLDCDMTVSPDWAERLLARMRPGVLVAPICYSLHPDQPASVSAVSSKQPGPGVHGWWRETGWGMAGVCRADLDRLRWDESFTRWGGEDLAYRDAAITAGLTIDRWRMDGLFHRWHPASWRHQHTERMEATCPTR